MQVGEVLAEQGLRVRRETKGMTSGLVLMCGIIGIAARTPVAHRQWLAVGRDTLSHRGPDDAGEWWSDDGRVGLAHRRLSILIFPPQGTSRWRNPSGTLTTVFNGEIYNFMEVRAELVAKGASVPIPNGYGGDPGGLSRVGRYCLSRFNGTFAFALHDARNQVVFLARDRAGEKPLFYHQANGALRFASELKGLLADSSLPRLVDPESLDCYLAVGYVPGERCILRGFNKLGPAHAMLFDLATGESKVWVYRQLPELDAAGRQGTGDDAALLDELEKLLEDAVGRQLMADVPVGVLLSGGVDSSLVTAMAVRASSKVKTYTIRFPGHGKLDETEHARLIARHFGTEHTELEAQSTAFDQLPRLARQFDEPIVDSSMIPTLLVSELVRQHCTVALGGDGGDELFAGYLHHTRVLWMQRHLRSIPWAIRQAVSFGAERLLPVGVKGRNYWRGVGVDLERGLPLLLSYFDPDDPGALDGEARGVACVG